MLHARPSPCRGIAIFRLFYDMNPSHHCWWVISFYPKQNKRSNHLIIKLYEIKVCFFVHIQHEHVSTVLGLRLKNIEAQVRDLYLYSKQFRNTLS